jgi:hypothetical protein
MKETALFVGWGPTHPGREVTALETFHEWTAILEQLKKDGEIEDFLPVLLQPHGGELEGFTLIFGDPVVLAKISERPDMHKLQLRGMLEHTTLGVIPAVVGEAVEREYKLLHDEILPSIERTPALV